jgi:UDP:flavonoid glycosyltransferase YjiC (YdhE family)
MRILITTSAWAGHYFPMVPLGWALQSYGHEVRVLCTPTGANYVKNSGLMPVPVLNDHDNPLFWPRLWYLERVKRGHALDNGLMPLHPVTGERMTSLDEFDWPAYKKEHPDEAKSYETKMWRTLIFVKTWEPELIIHDLMSTEGPFAATMHGVPAILHLWGPVGTAEPDEALQIVPEYDTSILEKLGVTAKGDELIKYVIDPCPVSMQPPVHATRLPMRYVPYNGPGEAPQWVHDQPLRKRILVVWGHTLSRFGNDSFLVPEILKALSDVDADVKLAINPKEVPLLGEIPANVEVHEQFPIHLLLPHCDAVVHHGGAGTVMSSVVAGVPQLALPFETEQHANGVRVAAAGAGLQMLGKDADVTSIRASVQALLDDPSFKAAALKLQAELADRPSPAELVPELERLAREGEPPARIDWESVDPALFIAARAAGRTYGKAVWASGGKIPPPAS